MRYSPGGPIVLARHDLAWAVEFAREADAIRAVLRDVEIAVHHIGSSGTRRVGNSAFRGVAFFRRQPPMGLARTQIHAYAASDAAVQAHLDFRDYLRAHPGAADAYARLKERLAQLCGTHIESYAGGKTDFVRHIERRAALWRAKGDHDDA
jgi:GrpB-like predicted nucleotidyltransferase (UPF0157 family)